MACVYVSDPTFDAYLHVKRTRAEGVFEGVLDVIKYGNGRTRPPGQARADAFVERASAWDGVDYEEGAAFP